jgi:hypothetical protein
MIILLIISVFLLLFIVQIAMCILLVKLSEQMGELWKDVQIQNENINILLNWVGGVQKNQQ